ncbi:MAG: TetR family transcriptional regulator [Pseudomonadota bacterium]
MTSTKRDAILNCALTLFEQHGFRATGIDKILAQCGCAKMTLYNHFTSKEELILECVRLHDTRLRQWMIAEIEARAQAPSERLLAVFDVASKIVEQDSFNGCLFARAVSEFNGLQDPIREAAADNKRLLGNYLHSLCEAARLENPTELSRSIHLLLEGAMAYAHVCDERAAPLAAKDTARRLIEQHASAGR